ncbi:MAG TPA: hypothetical protein VLA19_18500, partial [Herpetosiphonaceae bacterium]|nr:hypothetical protein [Herpetosiphonaceae bacterium]
MRSNGRSRPLVIALIVALVLGPLVGFAVSQVFGRSDSVTPLSLARPFTLRTPTLVPRATSTATPTPAAGLSEATVEPTAESITPVAELTEVPTATPEPSPSPAATLAPDVAPAAAA